MISGDLTILKCIRHLLFLILLSLEEVLCKLVIVGRDIHLELLFHLLLASTFAPCFTSLVETWSWWVIHRWGHQSATSSNHTSESTGGQKVAKSDVAAYNIFKRVFPHLSSLFPSPLLNILSHYSALIIHQTAQDNGLYCSQSSDWSYSTCRRGLP